MAIVMRNRAFMFTVFQRADGFYMTVTAGGVAQYDITIRLDEDAVRRFETNENEAIALAKDVATRTAAYQDRLISPSIDPS